MPRYRVQAGERVVHRGSDHHEARQAYSAAVTEAESTREEVILFCDAIVSERYRPQERKEGLLVRLWRGLRGRERSMEKTTNAKA